MEDDIAGSGLVRKGSEIFRRRVQVLESPSGSGADVVADVNELRGSIPGQRNLELIQWKVQTVANRFDVRFFSRPAAEESVSGRYFVADR